MHVCRIYYTKCYQSLIAGVYYYQNTPSADGTTDALGCQLPNNENPEESETKLPAGLFALLNGFVFFYYVPFLLGFVVLWRVCSESGRRFLVELCFGTNTSTDKAELAEKIGVGGGAAVGMLFSVASLILGGISEKDCTTTLANAFIALHVFVTAANAIACIQVSVIYYGGFKKCWKESKDSAKEAAVEGAKELAEEHLQA